MFSKFVARAIVAAIALTVATAVAPLAQAQPLLNDEFYTYNGQLPLDSYSPGEVLDSRTVPYHLANVPMPLQAIQVLYRSTDAMGRPSANLTSILRPANAQPGKVLSYQSIYDSLNPDDAPSRAIAGNLPFGQWTPNGRNIDLGGVLTWSETALFAPMLTLGYTVVIPDTEGPTADFAAGPEYGMMTLDSLRAAKNTPAAGVTADVQIALMGYSGGAIATNWAAILAPDYAPDINADLIGAAEGGVLVNPSTNLNYVGGSLIWSGVGGMAVIGMARAYDFDLTPYLTSQGREIVSHLQDASIPNAAGQYPGLSWQSLAKAEYANPNSIPEFLNAVNATNMGTAPIPTIPMFIAQGANGILEGTPPGGPEIGPGDGVMVADDVAALANRYCDAGLAVQYDQYDTLSHVPSAALWLPGAVEWLVNRFNGAPAPTNCGRIAPGNSLAPQQIAPTGNPAPPVAETEP
ncbi:lipase family protein [Rhodococcus sp. BH5]|uniref:lipase family protein n=1 Tax=Rhodococcus sp. BH5 TaxID=2871702 RepID=UPI0022CD7C61|nr:lipase family protein [Rhodococcus sp. BH5]MCZ9635239.1 lipase family protein [Rhodococcus sp. BH5]